VAGEALRADLTVTFAALKPGLLQGDGPALAGEIEVADIGLDPSGAQVWLVEDMDVRRLVPLRSRDANKWQSGVAVVAGSPGMLGAASLCARAAYRAGAGMVRLGVPGSPISELPAVEAVGFELPRHGWAPEVLEVAKRCKALVVGPGIGRDPQTAADVRALATESPVPVVIDADALFGLGSADEVSAVTRARNARSAGNSPDSDPGPIVLTPHAGEYKQMFGAPPAEDRIRATVEGARATGCILLLKGATTVVAQVRDDGPPASRIVRSGGPSLATAGTGDVLSGAIGAFIARGTPPLEAAALAAHAHGRAASLGPSEGLVAGDVVDLLSKWLSSELHPDD
jgi:hydroxyethylthiazole kinase-like uncharacterized protein yjeF